MLHISNEHLTKKQVMYDLSSLMPQLFEHSKEAFMSKAGATINFYEPIIIDISEDIKKQEQLKKENEK